MRPDLRRACVDHLEMLLRENDEAVRTAATHNTSATPAEKEQSDYADLELKRVCLILSVIRNTFEASK